MDQGTLGGEQLQFSLDVKHARRWVSLEFFIYSSIPVGDFGFSLAPLLPLCACWPFEDAVRHVLCVDHLGRPGELSHDSFSSHTGPLNPVTCGLSVCDASSQGRGQR